MNDLEITRWMRQLASVDERDRSLPDPSVIWLKAQVLQSAKDIERASRPITTVQMVGYAVVAAAWAALLTWKWAAIQAWMGGFTPSHILLKAAGAQASTSLSISFFMTLIVLGSLTVMLAMHTILTEE